MLELASLALLTSKSVLFLNPYFHSSIGTSTQTSALPLEALMVLTGVMLLGRQGLGILKLFSFTSQSHRRHGRSVWKLPGSPCMEREKGIHKEDLIQECWCVSCHLK